MPSGRPLFALGVVVWALGLLLVWTSGLPVAVSALLTAAALVYLLGVAWRARRQPRWKRLVRDSTGAWWLDDEHGNRRVVEPLGSSVVSPWLVIFQGRMQPRGRVSLWLPASRVEPAEFRRLSAWLKLLD